MDTIEAFVNHPFFYWLLVAIYVFSIVSTIVVVLSENRNPVKSLAWVTILILLPLVGLVLYVFFGRSIKNTRMISRRLKRRLLKNETFRSIDYAKLDTQLNEESVQLIKLTQSLSGSPFYPGNKVGVYVNGADKFAQLEKDLLAAEKYILLQYYIIENDEIGCRIKDLLISKSRAGVKVKVIYDHVGCINVRNRFFREMRNNGVEIYPFFRVTFPAFATRINWRNHRKLCVIDGNVGYIGGMNIADRYITGGRFSKWRDTHLRIEGPAVNALRYSFAVDWSFMGQTVEEHDVCRPISKDRDGVGMQMLTCGPTSQWPNLAFVFHKAIANAKKRIYLQTPYFLPTENLLKTLQTAALSKVDVRIMLPRHSDSVIMSHASFSYIQECLKSGIKFYLYNGGMLHCKTLLVDDEFSTVGSTNFDFRSFEHNFESNMFMYSKVVNEKMAGIFLDDQKECVRVTLDMWRKRPFLDKALESVLRLLSPIL